MKNIKTAELISLRENDIEAIFDEIKNSRISAMDPHVLVLNVLLDFSGSVGTIFEKIKRIMTVIYNSFMNDKCPCETFLILNCVYNSKIHTVHCDFIDRFDYEEFNNSTTDYSGTTPLVEMFEKSDMLTNRAIEALDKNERLHPCPVFIIATDYMENASYKNCDMNERFHNEIAKIQDDVVNGEKMVLEFVLTKSQCDSIGFGTSEKVENGITFGGYRCFYKDEDISDFIEALKLASSTIDNSGTIVPPRADIESYNQFLTKTMLSKMEALWSNKNI